MQCVYVNLHAPTYIKVIYPTARDIAQAAYRRALSKKGEPSQGTTVHTGAQLKRLLPFGH